MPCSRSPEGGGGLLLGVSAPWGVAFCYGLLVWWPSDWRRHSDWRWPSGMVLGGQKAITEGHHTRRHHTRRPPHQKATTERGVCLVEIPHTTHPPGRLLLRAVCILMECILVLWKFALQRCFQKFVYLSYLLQPKNSEGSTCDYHSIWRSFKRLPGIFYSFVQPPSFRGGFFLATLTEHNRENPQYLLLLIRVTMAQGEQGI